MAQESTGTIHGLPNYAGVLATASETRTPFFTLISSNPQQTQNYEFPTSSEYDFPAASQPDISENDSKTAPTAKNYVRDQKKNVTQIHQEAIELTYEKLSNAGRLSGLNTQGQVNNAADEMAFQETQTLIKIARDINYSCLNGTYVNAGSSATANKTRGMIELCASFTTLNAAAAELSKTLMDSILEDMFQAGAEFANVYIVTNTKQKQKINDIYGFVPQDRQLGGLNIQEIVTDYGNLKVILDKDMPQATLLFADISVIKPVYQPVPQKGNFFIEELDKGGAVEKKQAYGKFGLDHGPGWMHATITNLSTN